MNLKQQFDAIVAEWDLNKHPFYESWRAGTLPVDTLRRYAETKGEAGMAQYRREQNQISIDGLPTGLPVD